MAVHFILRQKGREYLLLKSGDCFHIVDMDGNLTGAKREQLASRGCTVEQMQSMGLSGMTIPRSDIKGLAIEGYGAGDRVEFRLNRGKQSYEFAQRYDSETGDAFFKGVPRLRTSRSKAVKGGKKYNDWRLREQEPLVRKRMKVVGRVLKIVSALSILGFLFGGQVWQKYWAAAGALCALTGLSLLVFFGPYFSVMPERDYYRAGYSAPVVRLMLPFAPMVLVGLVTMNRFDYFGDGTVFSWVIGFVVAVCLILWIFVQEFHDHPEYLLASAVFSVMIGAGLVSYGNHALARGEFVVQTATIEGMHKNSGGRYSSASYNCVVEFPDGRELTIDVGWEDYEQLEIGDTLEVPVRTGAFGLEYAYYGYNG